MKTRNGFVSNSSTSSFIITKDKGSVPRIKITMEVDLDEYAEDMIEATTKEELVKCFKDRFWEDYKSGS